MMSVRFSRLPMRVKVSVLALAVVVGALGLAAGATIVQTNYLIASKQRHTLEVIASSVATSCELPMAVRDVRELNRSAAEALEADADLLFIAIFDAKRELVSAAVNDQEAWRAYQSSGGRAIDSITVSERGIQHHRRQPLRPWLPAAGLALRCRRACGPAPRARWSARARSFPFSRRAWARRPRP